MAGSRSPWWEKLTNRVTTAAGTKWATLAAFALVAWGVTLGSWEVVDRFATAVSLLMLFLLLASTNRGDKATHLKLDEVIRAIEHADNSVLDAEDLSEEELDRRIEHYKRLRGRYRPARGGEDDDGTRRFLDHSGEGPPPG
jgi:low affinity Fe/Cu permease